MKEKKWMLKKVTSIPIFFLKILGMHDAKKSYRVVEYRITHWMDKLRHFENQLIVEEEEVMPEVRDGVAIAISKYIATFEPEYKVPTPPNSDPKLIRRFKTEEEERLNRKVEKKALAETILHSNQAIISSNVILHEKLESQRNICLAVIDAYLTGVCKVLPDFEAKVEFSDEAFNIYSRYHSPLDTEVEKLALELMQEEG